MSTNTIIGNGNIFSPYFNIVRSQTHKKSNKKGFCFLNGMQKEGGENKSI